MNEINSFFHSISTSRPIKMVDDALIEQVDESPEIRFTRGPLLLTIHEHDVQDTRRTGPLLELP